jgi:ABC-type nitrate/sulfonate/bicarbonate transport system permease component
MEFGVGLTDAECADLEDGEVAEEESPVTRALNRMLEFTGKYLGSIVLGLAVLGIWETLGRLGIVPFYIAPVPTRVLGTIFKKPLTFGDNALWTLKEVWYGFAIGLMVGIVLGLAISYSKLLDKVLYPIIVASQTIPTMALAPILVTWLGFGIAPKLFIVALITFFPITIGMVDGLRSVDPEILRFARALGATEWQMLRKIKLPSLLPHLFTGIKVAATYATIGAVVGEWVGSHKGLGALMLRANHVLATDVVFGTVLLMSLMGIAMFLVAVLVERLVIPWHYARTRRQ